MPRDRGKSPRQSSIRSGNLKCAPVPVPCLDQFARHFWLGRPVRLHDDEAADQLHAFLDMRDDLQPVLAPQVEMRLSGDEPALRRPRQEL